MVEMGGFRVVCDLSEILEGIRKRSFLYVDIERLSTIRDLCFRIKATFNIKENVVLMIDDVYLPFRENIRVLRPDDVIRVVLIDSGSSYAQTNTEIPSQNNELNHVSGNGLFQSAEEIIHAYGKTIEMTQHDDILWQKPRNRKRKKQTNVSESSINSDIQVLTENILDSSEAIGLEKPDTKRNKRKRRQKQTDIRPEEENIVQEQTDFLPELVTDAAKQSTAEIPINESIPVIPTGDPEPISVSRKRKRTRIRKKKATKDITPESNSHHNCSYNPALNSYTKSFGNGVDPNVSHIRFSSSTSSNVKEEYLAYNPLEDDLLVRQDESVEMNRTVENGSETNGITSDVPKIIAPRNGIPLVVRRARIDPVKTPDKPRKFLQNPPELNDIITFKIWKMDQNYCPQISGLIKAKVLNFCNDSKQVRFFILDGKSHCEQPNGKFSLDMDFTVDGPIVPPDIPDIMELNWQEMLEAEIFL